MKKMVLLSGVTALLFVGCASSDHEHFARYHDQRDYYGDHPVPVAPGDRVYVREYDNRNYNYDARENNWNRQYRGKHPDALGWNDPYWNR